MPVNVWDPLVRVFHWGIVLAFAVAYLSGDEAERTHEISGYVVLGLALFRILWGFIGSRYALFGSFVAGPAVVMGYLRNVLRGKTIRTLGHSPAGAVMVILLIASMLAAAASGYLLASDTDLDEDVLEAVHEWAARTALALVGLHVMAVLVASVRLRENLVAAMFTGRKRALTSTEIDAVAQSKTEGPPHSQ